MHVVAYNLSAITKRNLEITFDTPTRLGYLWTQRNTKPEGGTMKAYGYVRVSGKGQVEGDGFTRQEEAIRSFAKAAGIEVAHVYREEGVSGTTDEADRPAFQDMVSAILKNGVRAIIVEGLDRLAREYRIQETLLVYLASKGITLYSARTGENVTEAVLSDPMRKALVQIQGVFAELEKGLLVKKLRQARERKREKEGRCEGRKGYAESAPEVLDRICQIRRKAPGKPRRTWNEVAALLNEENVPSMSGKPWTGPGVQTLMSRERAR